MNRFFDLHRPGRPFVLPNAWDLGSARALLAAGFEAIGTTSLGVAASHGIPDATRAARHLTLAVTADLRRAEPECLLTCDLEDGFSDDPGEVAELVAGLGAVGVNIEDATAGALIPAEQHAAKIRATKARCPDVFLNARTDVFWLGTGTFDDAIERARTYVEAGADGIFFPGELTLDTVRSLTRVVDAPVNVLASRALSYTDLATAGVARISTGSLLYRAALTRIAEVARAVRDGGPIPAAISYEEVQSLVRAADR